ncbi:MAG: hypothetical protein FJW23_12525 [Acidimicrobiia bacterium]|nr:hypothetical protein [Acidimicrobiia bacterium]
MRTIGRTAAVAGISMLVGAGLAGQGRGWTPLNEPEILAGGDVGFRVYGMTGAMPTGVIVVRVNGQWVEARIGTGPGHVLPTPPEPGAPPRPGR